MEFLNSVTIFEDADLIIINKPPGFLSIEDGFNSSRPNLRKILKETYGEIWTVHRLDRMTSGLILFAKNREAHHSLNEQFLNRLIQKEYRAIVHGMPIWDHKIIDLPLMINGDRKHRTIYSPKGNKAAITEVIALKKCPQKTFFAIKPKTGYIHQIRAHLSVIGFPILGDRLYWRSCDLSQPNRLSYPYPYKQLFLHANQLRFIHPKSNAPIKISIPLPAYFSEKNHAPD